MARWVAVALLTLLAGPGLGQETPPDVGELSLEQLLDVRIISASNVDEGLAEAPATVLVITREELLQRGYRQLTDLLDDLPGMDVVRPRGATDFKVYWRGYRNSIGEPFLLMLDGLVLNHLYFNSADVLSVLPLSSLDRVEVVYGPASSVYGANAFMGVVHLISRGEKVPQGASQAALLSVGEFGERLADASFAWREGETHVTLTARFENGDLDRESGERYEYTRQAYYADRRLWGGLLGNPALGGSSSSPHRHRALDLRLVHRGLEAGLLYARHASGYGAEYAADRAQAHAIWSRPELTAFARGRHPLGERVTSTTLLRYRRSDVGNDSYFVESYPGTAADPEQRVAFSYWRAFDESFAAFQDVEVKASPRFSFWAGLRYEEKDLQKAYDPHYGPALPAAATLAADYPFPLPVTNAAEARNRVVTEDRGVYGQAKWRPDGRHQWNLGLRYDDNSQYGGSTTLRAGYVGTFGRWGLKALYGEAYQEPNPRLLYGGWTGSGSDPDLAPERSRTAELSGSFRDRSWHASLGIYHVRNRDTIVNTAQGAQNLGERRVTGLEAQAQKLLRPGSLQQLRIWATYSRLFEMEEDRFDDAGRGLGSAPIGDLAENKLHLGATAVFGPRASLTVLGRLVGERQTVDTNPVRAVGAWASFDANLLLRHLGHEGVGASLRVTNLFDSAAFDPGVREASAGVTPGAFDASGLWHGSAGYYSSLLPRPGRAFTFTMLLEF